MPRDLMKVSISHNFGNKVSETKAHRFNCQCAFCMRVKKNVRVKNGMCRKNVKITY